MDKLFETSWEQHLRAVTVYYKSATGIVYYDSAKTEAVTKADLIRLFKLGVLVVDDGVSSVRPTVMTVAAGYASVSHTTVGASDIAVSTVFYSAGYVA